MNLVAARTLRYNVYFLCFLNFFEILKIAQFHIQNVSKTYTSTQNIYKTYIKMYIKQKKFLIEQHSVSRYVNDSHMIITQYVIDYTQYLMLYTDISMILL